MINLVQKNNKTKQKDTTKNKERRQIHIKTQNAKKQSNMLTNYCAITMCTHDIKMQNSN